MGVEQIKNWFGKVFPEPKPRNLTTQMGVHFEEVAEMVGTLRGQDDASQARLDELGQMMERFATDLKKGNIDVVVDDEIELLDSLCDQVVTAVGVGHMHGMDFCGALAHVADSNDSKFDKNGEPIFDENLKVMKGEGYFRPELSPFLNKATAPNDVNPA